MTELTPELLAQLEAIALHLEEDDGTEDADHVGEVLAALPTLIAAVREREQLRIKIANLRLCDECQDLNCSPEEGDF